MIAFFSRVFRRIRGGCDERFGHKTKLDVVLRVIRISERFGHKTKLDEEIPASATLTNSTTPFFLVLPQCFVSFAFLCWTVLSITWRMPRQVLAFLY
jgi:hypothetical protein